MIAGSLSMLSACSSSDKIVYPETPKGDVTDTIFGRAVADPYRWLEDDRSEATAQWVKAQNEITYDYLSKIPFREALRKRMAACAGFPQMKAPFRKNGKYYAFKNDGIQNQDVLYVMDSLDGESRVLLDPNTLSEDGTVALSNIKFSKDGRYLAYAIARNGSDWNEIFVLDTETGSVLPDHIEWVKFSDIAWDESGFYYSAYSQPEAGQEMSAANRDQRVYYHKLGDDPHKDKVVFKDSAHPLRSVEATITSDGQYLVISQIESTTGNALHLLDVKSKRPAMKTVADDFTYDYVFIDRIDGYLYLYTNREAPRGKIVRIDPKHPEKMQTVVAESEHAINRYLFAGGKLIVGYNVNASDRLFAYTPEGTKLHEIELPGIGCIREIEGDFSENDLFYRFTSYIYPPTLYRYACDSNRSELVQASAADFDPELYESNLVFYPSKDGTQIPMYITHKKGITLDGKNPTLLYGYGGFSISMSPRFITSVVPFLEQGGIYAEACLRGGSEYGEEWHLAGTKMQKQNVFDDFISAAEYLIGKGYTNPRKLGIHGGSNGGLLIGACMTQRPDLFAVALPAVGVLDMLRYHKFTIGWAWATDYGTSEESPEMFEYLLRYSPLHNLRTADYPATLVLTNDHDDRVVPAHSFKFAATLQEANCGEHPTLIRIGVNAGHGAGMPRHMDTDYRTDIYSFLMYNLGMKPVFE